MPSRPRSALMACVAAWVCACAEGGAGGAGGAGAGVPTEKPTASGTHAALAWTALRREIGDAACDSDDQCRSVGIGAKPCGGPQAYVAWSSLRSDANRLTALVAKHRAAAEQDNARSGKLSDCAVLAQPSARCLPRAGNGQRACQIDQRDPRDQRAGGFGPDAR